MSNFVINGLFAFNDGKTQRRKHDKDISQDESDSDAGSFAQPSAQTISSMEAHTLAQNLRNATAEARAVPGAQPDNERSMEAPDFARRSSMEVDQTTRHGHQGANTLSSTGGKQLAKELTRAMNSGAKILEEMESEDEDEHTDLPPEMPKTKGMGGRKSSFARTLDTLADHRKVERKPSKRAGSTLHGAQDSCLAQMKAELEHLQLLTDALRAKEVKEAQANGDMDAREGLVARHLGETVDKLKKKARTLTRLNETKTRDWGMEQRQNVRAFAMESRLMGQAAKPKLLEDSAEGVTVKDLECVAPDAWGPLKYGWRHCAFLAAVSLAVLAAIVVLNISKSMMPHEGAFFTHLYGLAPGLPHVHPLKLDPLQRVEVELILPADPSLSGGHRRRRSRSLLGSPDTAGLGLGLGRAARLDRRIQSYPGSVLGGRRMLAAESADEHDDDQLLASNSDNKTHEEAEGDSQIAAAVMVKLEQEVDGVWRALGTDGEGTSFALRDLARMHYMIIRPKNWEGYQKGLPLRVAVHAGWEMAHEGELANTDLLPFEMKIWQYGVLGDAQPWIALVVLLVVLALIAAEVIHRMLAAMAGSFVMLGLLLLVDKTPDLVRVVEFIDEGALALLFGMMILVGKLASTGVFEVATFNLVGLSRGNTFALMAILCSLTAVLSAFLDNVTTVLLLAPVTVRMCQQLDIDPLPFLLSETLFSNIGGTATLIGDPPNIIIGNALSHEIGFVDFIKVLMPGVLLMSPFCMLFLKWYFRDTVNGTLKKYEHVLEMKKGYKIRDEKLLHLCLIVLGGVILSFLMHPVHHVNPAWVAILGAVALMLCSSGHNVHHDLQAVDWDVLLFFAALFVMVESMGEVGLIRGIGDVLTTLIEAIPADSRVIASTTILIWCSAIISAFLDNIPYTATMVPVIEQLADAGIGLKIAPLAWALAFGACLGGNGSLIGASANIVVAGEIPTALPLIVSCDQQAIAACQ
eukprot:CAMPEP_0114240676 /NCGR_PEP_ID=MMETSP0058-20121206/9219_1 /TAXON_ID=36894 /ORGANISM="Pyramimonas parkeae, CCMP726" /LENGTH=974 /DNA_ID=CAMNT_0001353137 /DNA_START=139 /DNA_END=3064 /DNA_ORIENTATION=-